MMTVLQLVLPNLKYSANTTTSNGLCSCAIAVTSWKTKPLFPPTYLSVFQLHASTGILRDRERLTADFLRCTQKTTLHCALNPRHCRWQRVCSDIAQSGTASL
jgi:hypothetical protein